MFRVVAHSARRSVGKHIIIPFSLRQGGLLIIPRLTLALAPIVTLTLALTLTLVATLSLLFVLLLLLPCLGMNRYSAMFA